MGLANSQYSEWTPVTVTNDKRSDRPQHEPAMGWRRLTGNHDSVKSIGHVAVPTFFWGGKAARATAI